MLVRQIANQHFAQRFNPPGDNIIKNARLKSGDPEAAQPFVDCCNSGGGFAGLDQAR